MDPMEALRERARTMAAASPNGPRRSRGNAGDTGSRGMAQRGLAGTGVKKKVYRGTPKYTRASQWPEPVPDGFEIRRSEIREATKVADNHDTRRTWGRDLNGEQPLKEFRTEGTYRFKWQGSSLQLIKETANA